MKAKPENYYIQLQTNRYHTVATDTGQYFFTPDYAGLHTQHKKKLYIFGKTDDDP